MSDAPLLRHAPARVHGRYFVRPPAGGKVSCWLVGFHGQGQTADEFLSVLDSVPRSPRWLLASVQGLNRYYIRRGQTIVANWMTSQDRELVIADNVEWVDSALDRLAEEFGTPRAIVFAGFSQGVGMAYRAGFLGRRTCAAIIAGCGDVPPDLAPPPSGAWPRVLAATGTNDGWYTPDRLEADAQRLRTFGADAQTMVFEGGHEWHPELAQAAGRLLTEVEHANAG